MLSNTLRDNCIRLCLLAVFALCVAPIRANITLPAVFSDNMVLQRDATVPLWGWADPGERITVILDFWTQTVTAGKDGAWSVHLQKHPAGGPYVITLAGDNVITLSNVLFGEVWLCGGQSNMQMYIGPSKYSWKAGGVDNYQQVINEADYPQIRMLTVPYDEKTLAFAPKRDCGGTWIVCSPQTVGEFAAVPYFFGRKLYRDLMVPIGLLNNSLGGSQVEPWISAETFRKDACLHPFAAAWEKRWSDYQASLKTNSPLQDLMPHGHQTIPSGLYNGMTAPLVPFGIRGVIWYQGESNADTVENAAAYAPRFQALIRDWRAHWKRERLPFLFVQLPPGNSAPWGMVQEAQRQALALPATAMVSTIDNGNTGIHPTNKRPVGERLALTAEAIAYRLHSEYSGPLYAGMHVERNAIRLHFRHIGEGLATPDGQPLKGFTIAGVDGKFVPATAVIEKDTILVSSNDVAHPVTVRYAWGYDLKSNLINKNGLPAPAFVATK